jgi:hypothetical protein
MYVATEKFYDRPARFSFFSGNPPFRKSAAWMDITPFAAHRI